MDDFLYKIFFDREFFAKNESRNFGDKNFSKTKRRMRGERGPDRQQRHHRPWLIEERVHLRILELLREGRGKLWIAKTLGVGVQTVQRRAAVLRREDDEEGTIDFRTVRGEVCERHGAVTVWPCVQCAAEAERARRN